MKKIDLLPASIAGVLLTSLAGAAAMAGREKLDVQVPGGLAFAEFRGYETWRPISVSFKNGRLTLILGDRATVEAYESGIPQNGRPFPDGARMAKIHWTPKQDSQMPGQPLVPGALQDVDFMVKDSKRFADSAGWGYAAFEYDAAADRFSPATEANNPPQGHDARCGYACHTAARRTDSVFTSYARR